MPVIVRRKQQVADRRRRTQRQSVKSKPFCLCAVGNPEQSHGGAKHRDIEDRLESNREGKRAAVEVNERPEGWGTFDAPAKGAD